MLNAYLKTEISHLFHALIGIAVEYLNKQALSIYGCLILVKFGCFYLHAKLEYHFKRKSHPCWSKTKMHLQQRLWIPKKPWWPQVVIQRSEGGEEWLKRQKKVATVLKTTSANRLWHVWVVDVSYPYDGIKMLIQPPGNKSLLVGNGDSGQSVIKKNKTMVSPPPLDVHKCLV